MNYTKTLVDEPVLVTLNGVTHDGHLKVEQEIIMLRSDRAVLPDRRWSFTDAAGHTHQWDGREVPTLAHNYEHKPCDGACGDSGCEGYSVDRWLCLLCGERVEPAYVPDDQARTVGTPMEGMKSWTVTVTGYDRWPPQTRDKLDVTLVTTETPARSFAGQCHVASYDMRSWGDGTQWTAELVGVSELQQQDGAA